MPQLERSRSETRRMPVTEASTPACPICGAMGPASLQVTLDQGAIWTCGGCGSGLLRPRPSFDDLSKLHSNEEYFDHPYFQERRDLTPQMRALYDQRIGLVTSVVPLAGNRVLDVGCDTGAFLTHLQSTTGAVVAGVDISAFAVEFGRSRGLDLRLGTLEAVGFPAASFDVVCAFDLVEHVSDPQGFFQEACRILKPGGILVLETPNYDGLVYRLGRILGRSRLVAGILAPYQRRLWPAFHVQYFTKGSLAKAMRAGGLEPVVLSGRELSRHELAVESRWLQKAVLSMFAVAGTLSSHTLLVAIARKTEPGCTAKHR